MMLGWNGWMVSITDQKERQSNIIDFTLCHVMKGSYIQTSNDK
jgi:hypothetical protein